MTETLPVPSRAAAASDVDDLVRRYRGARGILMQLVTVAGGQVEGALRRLPSAARQRVEEAAKQALRTAYEAARRTQAAGRGGDRAHRTATAALGFAGGLGGLPTALAELPVTTTAILRSIQEIAAEHGEDPAAEETRIACLRVLGAGGPLEEDDGTDLAFVGARLTLTGPALNGIIAQIAPRFAALLGQKLAAQAVPVLGALAGAGTNLAFARYYQEMAHVHFGLRRLEREGASDAVAEFRARIAAQKVVRKG